MGTLTPFGTAYARQDGAGETSSEIQSAPSGEPLLSGADEALWIGFGAFVTIFLVVIITIIRARVIKPAERAARDTRFFEPAGADADISFDEPGQAGVEITKRSKKDHKKKSASRKGLDQSAPTEVAPEDAAPADVATETADIETDGTGQSEADAATEEPATTASPFAGLFRRQEQDPEPETPDADELALTPEDAAEPALLETQPDDVRMDHLPEVDRDYWHADAERRESENYARAEEERRMALEEAERARTAAAEAEAARTRRDEEYREAEKERRKAETALDQNMQAVAGMQEKLDAMAEQVSADAADAQSRMGASLDEKFELLSDELQRRLSENAADLPPGREETLGALAAGHTDAAFDKVAAYLERLEQSTAEALARLSGRIDALSLAGKAEPEQPEELRRLNQLLSERAAPAVAGALQLGEIVRSALPADRYELGRDLKTGVRADCVILRPGAPGFVIDARYPADAYDRYARADDKSREHAATAYRRAVLRHMIFVAEKLIIPDETEDFAILFVPNDAIFNDLHRHFADIVQDSYRARIWLVSPTSLMATLHVMSAATRLGAETRTPSEQALESAVTSLTERINAIEEKVDAAAAAPAQDAPLDDDEGAETDAVDAEFEEAEVEILSAEDEGGEPQHPFPLR